MGCALWAPCGNEPCGHHPECPVPSRLSLMSFLKYEGAGVGGGAHTGAVATHIFDLIILPCPQNRNYRPRWGKKSEPEPKGSFHVIRRRIASFRRQQLADMAFVLFSRSCVVKFTWRLVRTDLDEFSHIRPVECSLVDSPVKQHLFIRGYLGRKAPVLVNF